MREQAGTYISDLVRQRSQDKRRLPAFVKNDSVSSITDKLIRDVNTESAIRHGIGEKTFDNMQGSEHISSAMNDAVTAISTSHNIQQTLPDVEMCKQILVSGIISPNNLITTEMNYLVNDDNEYLGNCAQVLADSVKKVFQDQFKLGKQLQPILEDALFDKGSAALLVLPESSIDHAINSNNRVSTEDLSDIFDGAGLKHLGLLGNPLARSLNPFENIQRNVATESISLEKYVTAVDGSSVLCVDVLDNYNAMKMPGLNKKVRFDREQDIYGRSGLGLELYKPDSGLDKKAQQQNEEYRKIASLYPDRQFATRQVIDIKTRSQLDKETIGHPLVMRLPHESVIPIFTPGNPADHIAYYVVVDRTGNPVRMPMNTDLTQNMQQSLNSNKELSDFLAAKVNMFSNGGGGSSADQNLVYENAIQAFSTIIESDLVARLRNSIYGDSLEIAKPQDIWRLMFARACAKQHTQLIFIPKSLMTYIAFDYNDYGMGVSLLEKSKNVASLRTVLIYANVMGAIKNSITQRKLTVNIDKDDPDWSKTVAIAQHAASKATRQETPFGEFDPMNIVTKMQNSGFQTEIKGNGDNVPETSIELSHGQSNYTKVDTELDEMLKKWHIMSMWLTPETVDLAMGADYAASIHTSNILAAKRNKLAQEVLCEGLVDHVRKVSYNSKIIMDSLRSLIKANTGDINPDFLKQYGIDGVVNYFLINLNIELPQAETSKFEMQMEALDAYVAALDKVIPLAFMSDSILSQEMVGQVGGSVSSAIDIVKAYYIRRYLQINGILPELFDLVTENKNGKAAVDLLEKHSEHVSNMSKSIMGLLEKLLPEAMGNDKLINGLKEDMDPADAGATEEGDGNDQSADDDFGFDDGAADDGGDGTEEPTDEDADADADAVDSADASGDDTGDLDDPAETPDDDDDDDLKL